MYFSPSECVFFPVALRLSYERAGTWLNDAIEVTAEEFAAYGQGQPPAGMQRGSDEDGHPTWVPVPPISPEEELANWRETASISSRQGEQQLILSGLDEQVEAAIDGIADTIERKLTRAWYQRATVWERNNPQLIALGKALKLTEEQIDDLFVQASEL